MLYSYWSHKTVLVWVVRSTVENVDFPVFEDSEFLGHKKSYKPSKSQFNYWGPMCHRYLFTNPA